MARPINPLQLIITFFLLTIILQGTFSLDSEAFLEQPSENLSPFSPVESKRGGGRSFQTFLDAKRGGGRTFQFSREPSLLDLSKRAGGRNFQQFSEKRAGGRGFVQSIDDGAIFEDKRAGGRGFYMPAMDEKRGGARVFGFDEKRGGARGFYVPEDKRGGARVFGYNEKRGGGRSFQLTDIPDVLNKRGGGRFFRSLNDFNIYGDSTRPLLLKRGGGRSFLGFLPDFGNSFYSPTRHFYSSYTKKAPSYLQSPEFKRMDDERRPYWGTLMTAEKRAGGRTFPIESEESKEK